MKKEGLHKTPENTQSPEEKEAEKQQRRRFNVITTDREGWVGVTTIEFDERSQIVKVRYDINEPDVSGISSYPFIDDHIRGINNNFNRADRKSKKAGIDDRKFFIEREEDAENKYQSLLAERDKLLKSIEENTREKLRGLFMPIAVVPKIKKTVFTEKNESDDTRSARVDYFYSYELQWFAHGEVPDYQNKMLSSEKYRELSITELGRNEIMKETERLTQIGPPKQVQKEFEKLKEAYLQKKEDVGITAMEERYKEINKEIAEYYKEREINAPVDLFPPGSAECKALLEFLNGQKTAFIDDGSFSLLSLMDQFSNKEAATIRQEQNKARIEAEKRKAKIDAELTPEMRKIIENGMEELDVLAKILKSIPGEEPEIKKFVSGLPLGLITNLRLEYEKNKIGAEAVNEIEKIKKSLDSFINRKKINELVPNLKQKIAEILDSWKQVEESVSKNEEAQMVIADGLIRQEELIKRTRHEFLIDPWKASANRIIDSIVAEVVEAV